MPTIAPRASQNERTPSALPATARIAPSRCHQAMEWSADHSPRSEYSDGSVTTLISLVGGVVGIRGCASTQRWRLACFSQAICHYMVLAVVTNYETAVDVCGLAIAATYTEVSGCCWP